MASRMGGQQHGKSGAGDVTKPDLQSKGVTAVVAFVVGPDRIRAALTVAISRPWWIPARAALRQFLAEAPEARPETAH